MSLGVFGGTFDPVHCGHLALAEGVRDRFALDRVLLLPARVPPHKEQDAVADWHHRLTMAALACVDRQGLAASGLEGSRQGPSYSVDTLAHFRAGMAPEEPLFFLMGADSLADLPSWREPERILSLANLVVAPRPGVERAAALAPLDAGMRQRVTDAAELADGAPPAAGCIYWVELPLIDLSGSGIRRRVREGGDIGGLVPQAIAHYISRYHLYR